MEKHMNAVIDLRSELLIDRSQFRDPYVRLLLTALGEEVANGSPWIAVDKRVASRYDPLLPLIDEHLPPAAA
jgi:hypothetical protein